MKSQHIYKQQQETGFSVTKEMSLQSFDGQGEEIKPIEL